MEVVNALGRRKRAIARVFVSEGTGKITINKRDLAEYFPSTILQYVVKQPLNKLSRSCQYLVYNLFCRQVRLVHSRCAASPPAGCLPVPDAKNGNSSYC